MTTVHRPLVIIDGELQELPVGDRIEEPRELWLHGRVTAYINDRWSAASDDQYGTNNQQWNEDGGQGTLPNFEYEHMGHYMLAGRIIKNITIFGRANSTQITSLQCLFAWKVPNPITRYETGIDNDGELDHTIILNDQFWTATSPLAQYDLSAGGNTNDRKRQKWEGINFETPTEGELVMYFRGVNTNTTRNRYFYCQVLIEYY